MAVGAPRVRARWRDARFPVRSKLVAVLLLPVLLLLVLGTSQVIGVRQDATEARAESRLAAAVAGPGSFLNLVVDERNHTAVYLLGAEELISSVGPGRYLETRQLVDEARADFLEFIEGEDDQVNEIYGPAVEAIAELDALRADVDASTATRDFQNVAAVQDLFQRFGEVTGPLFDANRRVSLIVTEPVLQRGAALVDQSLRQSDTIALLTYGLVVTSLAGEQNGVNTPDEYVEVASLLRDLRTGEQIIRLNGEGTYAPLVEALFASEHIQEFPRLVESALAEGAPNVRGLFANAGDEDAFGYDKLRAEAEARIADAAADIDADADRTQQTFTIVGLLVLIVLGVVTTFVARSITKPLRSLTRQAMAMAGERLPGAVQGILDAPPSAPIEVPQLDPIDVRTRDEVADVARALTTVQDSALGLAVEQAALRRNIADSFVHLGRRNQTLLGRQLDFITELEKGETDPTALSNLFRLDHLATRMRRNAESLLVLAGIEPPRVWRVPVALVDIVRAALGEIENYQRVEITGIEPVAVIGSATADLAHLLAELVENALAFSSPLHRVEVSGAFDPLGAYAGSGQPADGGGRAYAITIADSGIGMAPEDIAKANQRLAGEESFAIAPSQYLGHYVAGMIAHRHGIHVRLDSAPHQGTLATVTLPPGLISLDVPTPAPAPVAALAPPEPEPAQPALTRGLHPGGRAIVLDEEAGMYRVGESEFQIDFGSIEPVMQPEPATAGVGGGSGLPMRVAEWVDRNEAPALATPAARRVAKQATTAVGQAQRARYVRDTLSSLSAGIEKGRGAAAREEEERTGMTPTPGSLPPVPPAQPGRPAPPGQPPSASGDRPPGDPAGAG